MIFCFASSLERASTGKHPFREYYYPHYLGGQSPPIVSSYTLSSSWVKFALFIWHVDHGYVNSAGILLLIYLHEGHLRRKIPNKIQPTTLIHRKLSIITHSKRRH